MSHVEDSTSVIGVREVAACDVKVGDTIWAQDDGDWLLVSEIKDNGYGGLEFRRRDRSVAEFGAGIYVLVRADVRS